MRHQAEDAAALVADPGNVALGSVGVGFRRYISVPVGIAEHDAAFALEAVEGVRIGEVVALRVGGNGRHDLPAREAACEDRVRLLHSEPYVLADELERSVPHQDKI